MTTNRKLLTMLSVTTLMFLIGCGDKDNTPPPSATNPAANQSAKPMKPPATKDEKIKAIQNSSLPDDQKKAAIDRVNSGQL